MQIGFIYTVVLTASVVVDCCSSGKNCANLIFLALVSRSQKNLRNCTGVFSMAPNSLSSFVVNLVFLFLFVVNTLMECRRKVKKEPRANGLRAFFCSFRFGILSYRVEKIRPLTSRVCYIMLFPRWKTNVSRGLLLCDNVTTKDLFSHGQSVDAHRVNFGKEITPLVADWESQLWCR